MNVLVVLVGKKKLWMGMGMLGRGFGLRLHGLWLCLYRGIN